MAKKHTTTPSGKNAVIAISLNPQAYQWVIQRAAEEDRSNSSFIRQLILAEMRLEKQEVDDGE